MKVCVGLLGETEIWYVWQASPPATPWMMLECILGLEKKNVSEVTVFHHTDWPLAGK